MMSDIGPGSQVWHLEETLKRRDKHIEKLEAIICIYEARLYDPGFGPCPPDFSATQELLINEITRPEEE